MPKQPIDLRLFSPPELAELGRRLKRELDRLLPAELLDKLKLPHLSRCRLIPPQHVQDVISFIRTEERDIEAKRENVRYLKAWVDREMGWTSAKSDPAVPIPPSVEPKAVPSATWVMNEVERMKSAGEIRGLKSIKPRQGYFKSGIR